MSLVSTEDDQSTVSVAVICDQCGIQLPGVNASDAEARWRCGLQGWQVTVDGTVTCPIHAA